MITNEKMNKSEKIRRLFDAGMSVTEISNFMGVRYQFAYNVVSYHVKQKEAAMNDLRVPVASGIRMDA
ncbi:hypothetical protein D3C76_169670 [compost metagenome]